MNDIKELLTINFPIVQAPMLGVTTPAMVAAVSNAGALGSLPLGGLSPQKARELIAETRRLTDNTFSVNLFAHPPAPEAEHKTVEAMQDYLEAMCTRFHIPFERQQQDNFRFYYYQDLIEVLAEEKVPVVSFTFGVPDSNAISTLKAYGVKLIGTATSLAEAVVLESSGMDAVTVQGIEAGGHRGTFLTGEPLPEVGLFTLLPQVAARIKLPLLAAGGIYNGATIKAALALGASGVQIGSLFITATESAAAPAYKQALLNSNETSTVLTNAFSGRWARGIRNRFITEMAAQPITIPYYTLQNQLMAGIRAHAQANGITDFIAMWAGQASGQATIAGTHQIIDSLIAQL